MHNRRRLSLGQFTHLNVRALPTAPKFLQFEELPFSLPLDLVSWKMVKFTRNNHCLLLHVQSWSYRYLLTFCA